MLALALSLVFWTAVVVVLHTYAIYPFLLIVLDAVEQARSTWRYIGGLPPPRPPAHGSLAGVSAVASPAQKGTRRLPGRGNPHPPGHPSPHPGGVIWSVATA